MSTSRNSSEPIPFGCGAAAIVVAVLVLLGFFVFIGVGTYESVPPDKVALHYTGGPIEGTHYVEIVEPGTGAKFYGLSENIYKLSSVTNTYIISKNAAEGDRAGADHISAPSKDRVAFTFEAAVYFTVNADPKVLRNFFEEVCLHDKCYTDDGWRKMLEQYFRKPLELAVAQEAKKYDAADLYSNPDTLAKMNKAISKSLADDINDNIGIKNSFCGPNESAGSRCGDFKVIVKNPTPPKAVIDAYNSTKASQQKVQTAKQDAEAAKATAKGKADAAREAALGDKDAQDTRASAKTLTQEQLDYLRAQALLECAGNENCTLIVGAAGGVNVNTGK